MPTNTTVIYPSFYRIFECRSGRWFLKHMEHFYSSCKATVNREDPSIYGVTEQAVVVELFRINGGKSGYYLANFKDRKYYYCGMTLESVKATLLNLGIGRVDPVES